MTIIALLLMPFFFTSTIHLVFVYKEDERGRRITKVFPVLTLFLLTVYYFSQMTYSSRFFLTGLAFFFSLIGDVLFLYKKKGLPYLITGTLSFFLAHVFFLMASGFLTPYWLSRHPYTALYFPIVILIAFYPILRLVKGRVGLALLGSVYTATVTALAFSFIVQLIAGESFYLFNLVGLISALAFILSDLLNALTLFKKDVKRRDFYIMLPYLIAQVGLFFALVYMSSMVF